MGMRMRGDGDGDGDEDEDERGWGWRWDGEGDRDGMGARGTKQSQRGRVVMVQKGKPPDSHFFLMCIFNIRTTIKRDL